MAWTYTYDTDTPDGEVDAPSVIDDEIRRVEDAVQERLNVDHYFALTGTKVSDDAAGQHRQIEFYAPIDTPTDAANKAWLYGKDVGGKIELHWLDEDGNEIQITDAGSFNMGLLTGLTIDTPVLTSPVINTGVTGTAVLDEDDMASDSATQLATQQSIKAYVDATVAAAVAAALPDDDAFGAWVTKANNTQYTADTDLIVVAYLSDDITAGDYIRGETPRNTVVHRDEAGADNCYAGVTFPVKKGATWYVGTGSGGFLDAVVKYLQIGG